MAGRIQRELRQTVPIRLIEEEAALNVIRTAEVLNRQIAELLARYDLSPTQYNVLRIIRGAGQSGISCKDIGSRMITRDPDTTRLLDRLHRRALVTRGRARGDRRVVAVRLTPAGLALVNQLDEPVEQLHRQMMKHMAPARLRDLVRLLEEARGPEE